MRRQKFVPDGIRTLDAGCTTVNLGTRLLPSCQFAVISHSDDLDHVTVFWGGVIGLKLEMGFLWVGGGVRRVGGADVLYR